MQFWVLIIIYWASEHLPLACLNEEGPPPWYQKLNGLLKVEVRAFAIYLRTELLTPWSWPAWCRAPGPRPPWRGWGGRPAEARACWTLASSLGPAAFIPGPGARTQQQNLGSIKTIKQSWILQGDEWEDAWSSSTSATLGDLEQSILLISGVYSEAQAKSSGLAWRAQTAQVILFTAFINKIDSPEQN